MVISQLSIVINGYQWLSMVISYQQVINGYQWLSKVINGYQLVVNNYQLLS